MPEPDSSAPQQWWYQERPSPYPWEQSGLDHVRKLMPQAEPYRAWATFSFTDKNGRINECDLLVAVPGGLHLVELKGHTGRVSNRDHSWIFRPTDGTGKRTLDNPLHQVDHKAKELRSRLNWAAQQLRKDDLVPADLMVPRVEAAVFLSAPGLVADLDEVQRVNVYARDGDSVGLPWIWRDLLQRPPQDEKQRVTPVLSQHLNALLRRAGISASTAHLRFGDNWTLAPEQLEIGPTWEDRLAQRTDTVREHGRVRIYLAALGATDQERASVARAAEREYRLLKGINHRGIAEPVDIRPHQGGTAIRFRHHADDLRLDSYLAVHADTLTPEVRLGLVRQLAEALRYAHSRLLYHRALSARSIYVSARDDGSSPVLRVTDWQAAAREFDPAGHLGTGSYGGSPIGWSTLTFEHLTGAADVYRPPDLITADLVDPADLDAFGLGAVAYLIITGQAPAANRRTFIERLSVDGGLHLHAVTDGVSAALDELIYEATRTELASRRGSPDAFLQVLDEIERASSAADQLHYDPLTAHAGQRVDGGRWTVVRVLGTGSTARALLVEKAVSDDEGAPVERRVLKVALDEAKATRLEAEARVLRQVGGGAIVKLIDGPRLVGSRTVLDIDYAGGFRRDSPGDDGDNPSLGALLRGEGKLSYHDLERFGGDLFVALDHLSAKGVWHRDLKPDNLGVFYRADRSRQLMLFDFSLAEVARTDVTAGTRGYLDPFLNNARRTFFDDHAEWYAAAVTLHEMASSERPVWGDGVTDPRSTTDETPTLSDELFEPALREGLAAFFRRALHRESAHRFATIREMHDAWRAVFAAADAAAPATTPATVGADAGEVAAARDEHAAKATLDTPLEAAGLSPRAVSVARSFEASTVGELLDVPQYQITKARGTGALVRKELNRRHRQWSLALRPAPGGGAPPRPADPPAKRAGAGDSGAALPPTESLTVEEMARRLTPASARRGSRKQETLRLLLGLPDGNESVRRAWATQQDVAEKLGVTRAAVYQHQQAAAKTWSASDWLAEIRDELVDTLGTAGRIMTSTELATSLLAQHGSTSDTPAHSLACATGVVRAAVEAEQWSGMHPKPGSQSEQDGGPRMNVARRGSQVLVVLESLQGTDHPVASTLVGYAVELGQRADELAGADPLPGSSAVVRGLRAVRSPDGLPALADTRLVELAASLSERAAASPRLELYPRDLDLARAIRLSQAAAGVRHDTGIGVAELVARVRARFPDLELPNPVTHVLLGDALQAAGFPLAYDTVSRRFHPARPGFALPVTSSSTQLSAHRRMVAAGLDPVEVLAGKLRSAVKRGGFLALTLRGIHLPGAAEALAAAHPVTPFNVNGAFLAELRGLAEERDQDWDRVLAVDARFSQTGVLPRGFAGYVRETWQRVQRRLEHQCGARTVLFLHDAGLVARYHDAGGREFLTGLQHAARRADEQPHGLWLLCPGESAQDSPRLDGRTVEWLDASEWASLSGEFVGRLIRQAGSAA